MEPAPPITLVLARVMALAKVTAVALLLVSAPSVPLLVPTSTPRPFSVKAFVMSLPFKSSVALLSAAEPTVTEPVPKANALPTVNVPALTVVPPV